MKINKLTPGGNKVFESSRFIMPQHREQHLKLEIEMRRKARPEMDEQRLQDIAYTIGEAVSLNAPLTITVFGSLEDEEFNGRILKVDQHTKRIKLETGPDEWEWMPITEIVNARLD